MKKVKKHSKVLLSLVLAIFVFAGSVGVQFFYHSCSTSGKVQVAVSMTGTTLEAFDNSIQCCCDKKQETTDSCPACSLYHEPKSDKCCDNLEKELTIDVEFLLEQAKQFQNTQWVVLQTLLMPICSENLNFISDLQLNNVYLPPPYLDSGRKIVTSLRQLKLAHA